MLQAIIKFGRNLLAALIFAAMIITGLPKDKAYADYSENEIRKVDVVVRVGEWANENQAKPGKRFVIGKDINISQHGISIKEIPSDIPLRCENGEWFISEFDINMKLAKSIAKKLDNKYGVDVNLQYSTDKTTDLNAAGKIAAKCDPKIYLSVHHNSYNDDSTGYFFMYNQGDSNSAAVAQKLSNSIADNGYVPQRDNRANDGYIGELNHVKNTNRISILGEFGYFNKAEIVKICSEVMSSGSVIPFEKGRRVNYYIDYAGGYSNKAKKSKVYVKYMNGKVARAKKMNGRIIQPGCEIVVPKDDKERLKTTEILSLSSTSASLATVIITLLNILMK